MNANRRSPQADLPVAIRQRIGQACDRFEAAWKAGATPIIEQFVGQVESQYRAQLLEELIILDLAYCWRGEAAPSRRLDDYLAAFPELGPVDRLPLDLIREEYRVRRQWGDHPELDEYVGRFPNHDGLREALDRSSQLDTTEDVRLAVAGADTSRQGRGLHIRCPHCHNPVEIVTDTPVTDVTCDACGSQFSLLGETTETRAAPTLKSIGHFELIERLGMGGFATVWKARDTKLDRAVAVKIPRRGQLEAEEAEKFLREARATAQLNHPNIVAVHEVGRDEETIYIVSDLVRGVTLSDWITAGQPTHREAAHLCAKIAEAVHYAHERGIIHRDLKPQNILIDGANEPHVMDFGLAKREVGEITMTVDGQVLGTPAYMSPEQAQGEAHTADRRSDVYSLGVILFQLLTGELPFRGNAQMLIHQAIHDEPPSPKKLNGAVPRDLETICLKCLEKDPQGRYASASEVAAELTRLLDGKSILARPPSGLVRAWRWCQRNRTSALLVAAICSSFLFAAAVIAMAPHSQFVTQAMIGVFGFFAIAIFGAGVLVGIPYILGWIGLGWIGQNIARRTAVEQISNSDPTVSAGHAIGEDGEDVNSTLRSNLERVCGVTLTLLALSIGMMWLADRSGETHTAVASAMRTLLLVSLITFLLAGGLLAGLRGFRRQ